MFTHILVMMLFTNDGYVENTKFPKDRYETIEHCSSEVAKLNKRMEKGGVYPTIKMMCREIKQ